MRQAIGAVLCIVGAAGMCFLTVLPAGYHPLGILVAPATALALVGGYRMVRDR